MADTELVIKIPDRIYYGIEKGITVNGSMASQIVLDAVKNGTPLPKGHGRLIDADKAIREENSKLVDFETTNTRDRSYCRYARVILNNAQTIIEADRAENEDKT